MKKLFIISVLFGISFLANCNSTPGHSGSQNGNVIALSNGTLCKESERNVDACIQVYKPVCGWTKDPRQCSSQSCRESYANSCFACKDSKILLFTDGSCPGTN